MAIGIIGGTGLYDLDGLVDKQWVRIESPFGRPSDDVLVGRVGDQKIVFLPRHGRGHRIPPNEINFLANIDALKRAGVTQLISVSAVGSLEASLPPGHFVLVDQFIDRTIRTPKSFFGTGLVAHVALGHPTCRRLIGHLAAAAEQIGVPARTGGTYVVMNGPQFSTVAESEMHRTLRAHVVGMTNMPEAKLAREAELCYATVAMVTDFDCWHPDHDHVDVPSVVRVMQANAVNARSLLQAVIPRLRGDSAPCAHGCDRALEYAILTAPEARDPELCQRLDAVAGRVLRKTAG